MTIRPSIRLTSLPRTLPLEARLRIARDAGFEGIEVEVGEAPAASLRAAADQVGLTVHSVHCAENYTKPLSSPDPATRDAGIAATLATLEAAHVLGAKAMLLIPGIVDSDTSYAELQARSQEVIKQAILPEAERLGIVLTVENVWNGFLLSPFDCARYVDSFDSPHVRLCLDVGNIVFGRPEGWIDITGHCIGGLHLKDVLHMSGRWRRYRLARVGEGYIDWRRVRAALARAGISAWGVMAETEIAQPRLHWLAFQATRHLSAGLGANPAFRLVETQLARRVVADSMRRFRRHIQPSGGVRASAG